MIYASRLYRFGVDAHNPVLTNPEFIELMHNPCGGTDRSGSVGTRSINLEFSVNSVFVNLRLWNTLSQGGLCTG